MWIRGEEQRQHRLLPPEVDVVDADDRSQWADGFNDDVDGSEKRQINGRVRVQVRVGTTTLLLVDTAVDSLGRVRRVCQVVSRHVVQHCRLG